MLEYFAHLDSNDPPDDLVLATADIPENLSRKRIEPSKLPANWRSSPAPPSLARLGDDFIEKAEHCLLLIPSVLASAENNWLINPQHPEFKKIVVRNVEPLNYDPRMFRKQRGSTKHKRD